MATQAAATRAVVALDERHLVPPPGKVAGGGQAGEAGPDDDDAHASLQAIDRARDRRASTPVASRSTWSRAVEGEVDLVGDALLGLLEHAGIEHELLEHPDVGIRDDRAVPEVALGDVVGEEAAGLGEQHGGLAAQQVVADGLAGALRVAPDAEHVVAQGERLADVPAEGLERGQGVGVGPGGEGAEQERPLHGVGAGLEAGHPARLGEVAPSGRGTGDVEQLALHELAQHVGPGPLQRRRRECPRGPTTR